MSSVLIAGLSGSGTGLGNVLDGLTKALRRRHTVEIVAFVIGAQETRSHTEGGITVHEVGIGPQYFEAPAAWLEGLLTRFAPDNVLVSGPGFMALPFLRQLQPWRSTASLSLYLPVEGTLVGETMAEVMRSIDHGFLYTADALRGTRALCDRLRAADPAFPAPRLAAVGHGFAQEAFFPLEPDAPEAARRLGARRALWPGRADLDGAFIVLNANRVDRRKQLGLTLDAFGRFAQDRPDARLCLHTGRRAPHEIAELDADIDRFSLRSRIILSPVLPGAQLTLAELNLLYNACDVGVTTSSGEGWGLGLFEHAATRAAQVVPDHTSLGENWIGSALTVPAVDEEFLFYESAVTHLVDPADVAAALARLHDDPACRTTLARAAERNARQPRHAWGAVAGAMEHVLNGAELPGKTRGCAKRSCARPRRSADWPRQSNDSPATHSPGVA